MRLDPRRGAQHAVAEAARNIACVGAEPIAVTDCLNFGNPETGLVAWQLTEAVAGLAEACRALEVPIVSGNVSLYNETAGRAIPPTPAVGMVGLLEDVERRVPLGFVDDSRIVVLGEPPAALGASEYWAVLERDVGGAFPRFDLDAERRLGHALRELAARRLLRSAQDIGDGGLAIALAECCFVHGVGATLDVLDGPLDVALFSEDQGRAVVTCAPTDEAALLEAARQHGVAARVVGWTGGDRLRLGRAIDASVAELRSAWEASLV
jgi:phosphoribosylformylglycinamidine synthase